MKRRNPFKVLAAERITESDFFNLFEPTSLYILQRYGDALWDKTVFIRSSPGGGKTTLLHVFTPSILRKLYEKRNAKEYKPLFNVLNNFGIIGNDGVHLLGILIPLKERTYANIEDLDLPDNKKRALLYSLFNARIIIRALKGALILSGYEPTQDFLSKIEIKLPLRDGERWAPFFSSAPDLYDWACTIEENVYRAINDFDIDNNISSISSNFFALNIVNPANILVDGNQIADKAVLMLDDFHSIRNWREKIIREIIVSRYDVSVWIAERLEALKSDALLPGDKQERDYLTIYLEQSWQQELKNKYMHLAANIANKRAKSALYSVSSFEECIVEELDEKIWESLLPKISVDIETTYPHKKYIKWKQYCNNFLGNSKEKSILWRAMKILIERDISKKQKQITEFLDGINHNVIGIESFEKQIDSNIKGAARLFISNEFKVPYYFGLKKLILLSSYNIEQFLWLCSHIFDEYIANVLIKRNPRITPERQQSILERIIKMRLTDIYRTVPHQEFVKTIMDNICNICKKETYRKNAPYAPGVTGVAISFEDKLKMSKWQTIDDKNKRITVQAIETCIKNNLLLPKTVNQGKKTWLVLYINRMLCLVNRLPLQYGGWKAITLDRVAKWVSKNRK